MHATHLLFLPTSYVVLPFHYPPEVESYQVQVQMLPEITTGFWEDGEHPPRIRDGGQLLLEVPEPNNFSRLLAIKSSLLLALEHCHETEQEDGYPEWLRFRIEQALKVLQDDIDGHRLPNGLPTWNPATKTAELEVA